MARINLLPWREELRNQRNQEFGIVAGITAAVAILIIVGISAFYGQLIDNQESRNKFMQGEITKLDNKIKEIKNLRAKKERLLQRIATIQQLQTNRTEIVHLFDETVKTVPDGVYLRSLKQSGANLTMTGVAESNTRVSEFVRNIEASEWMQNPRINVISRNKSTALQTNNFTVQLKQLSPNRNKKEDGEG
jgi:type IV pilus assembly protein PilN